MPVDHRVSMRIILTRVLWIEGFPDQAREMAGRAVAYAEADNAFSLCQALALAACPVAFWRGDGEEAETLTTRLIEHATRYRLDGWRRYGEHYAKAGDGSFVDGSSKAKSIPAATDGLIGHTVLTFGRPDEIFPEATREEFVSDGWCSSELLRIMARQRVGSPDGQRQAEVLLLRSLEIAERQNALSWQLRTATDLASLWRDMRRAPAARRLLTPVYRQYTEGHETRDLRRAISILHTL
jgi:hypothetical protein